MDDGISVNPENCIDWFKVWYPAEYQKLMQQTKKSKFSNFINGLPKFFQR
jgi:hypothetical protein